MRLLIVGKKLLSEAKVTSGRKSGKKSRWIMSAVRWRLRVYSLNAGKPYFKL